jgi:hypothetical protein
MPSCIGSPSNWEVVVPRDTGFIYVFGQNAASIAAQGPPNGRTKKMKADIHPDYHMIKVVMTDGTEYDDPLDLGRRGRHAQPRHRLRSRIRHGPAATSRTCWTVAAACRSSRSASKASASDMVTADKELSPDIASGLFCCRMCQSRIPALMQKARGVPGLCRKNGQRCAALAEEFDLLSRTEFSLSGFRGAASASVENRSRSRQCT